MHGDDFQYTKFPTFDLTSIPVLKNKTWDKKSFGLYVTYELLNDVFMKLYYTKTNIKGYDLNGKTAQQYLDKFTSPFYQGNKHTFGMGFNLGF